MRIHSIVVVTVLIGACAQTPPERRIIDEAATALGGADKIRALKTLMIEGSGSAPNVGQNRMPNDELPVWKSRNTPARSTLPTGARAFVRAAKPSSSSPGPPRSSSYRVSTAALPTT